MKTRLGFVSNSSSSSYVVAIRPPAGNEPCPHCGRKDPNFLDIVEAIGARCYGESECTQLHERGLEQLTRHVNEKINEDEWTTEQERQTWKEVLAVAEKAVHKGYSVGRCEISYHDDAAKDLLKDLEKLNAIVVLWSDHRDVSLSTIKL